MLSRLFNDIPGEFIKETLEFFNKTRMCAPYDLVVKEGNPDGDLYLIEEGAAMIKVGGKEVGALQAGDIFGEVGFCASGKRTASVFAGPEGGQFRIISPTDFSEFGVKRPRLAFIMVSNLAHLLATKLQRTNQTLRSNIGRVEELEGEKVEQQNQQEEQRSSSLFQRLFSSIGST